MKPIASCDACGASFNAPASLRGQVVKCPACGGIIEVPESGGPPAAPAAGSKSDGTATGISGIPSDGSAADRPAIRLRPRPQRAPAAPASDESDLDRLRKSRLFQAYSGEGGHAPRGRFRFTRGLGIAIAFVLVGMGVGIYLIVNNTRTAPELDVARDLLAAPLANTLADAPAPDASPGSPAADGAPPAATTRAQAVNASLRWLESSPFGRSPTAVNVRVESGWDPATGQRRFTAHVTPDARGLSMASRVLLFRAPGVDGPFTQVDLSKPTAVDAGGALVFTLFDGQAPASGGNTVAYRLSGEDREGRRLFDTPAAPFPVVPPMRVEGGRLAWSPASESGPMPAAGIVVTAAAPGWEGVIFEQVPLAGRLDVPLPGTSLGAPARVSLRAHAPATVEAASGRPGTWNWATRTYPLADPAAADAPIAGVAPRFETGRLVHAVLPDPAAVGRVDPQPPIAGAATLVIHPADGSPAGTMTLPNVPAPQRVTVTPFEREIRLAWDPGELAAQRDRFEGAVAIVVSRRSSEGGGGGGNGSGSGGEAGGSVVATLPLDAASWTDREVQPGVEVSYEVRVAPRDNPDTRPLVRAEAYLAGVGVRPVLVEANPAVDTPAVAAAPGLSRLHIALGADELVYPDTDAPALAARHAILDALASRPGVAVLDRRGLGWAASRVPRIGADTPDPTEASPQRGVAGAAAHLHLRLLDAADRGGTRIELWCSDLLTGSSWRVASAPAEAIRTPADAAGLVGPLLSLVEAAAPEPPPESAGESAPPAAEPAASTPMRIVMGPLLPLDQPRRAYGGDALADTLVEAARGAGLPILPAGHVHALGGDDPLAAGGVVVLTGRVWSADGRDLGVAVTATDGPTARVLGTFHEERVGTGTEAAFAQWCATLRAPAPPPAVTRPSPTLATLRAREAGLTPLHPAYLHSDALDAPPPAPPAGRPPIGGGLATFAFGLPLPHHLGHPPGVVRRPADDPLAEVRPFIAQPAPVAFDAWVADYTRYIGDDYDAFRTGMERVNATLRQRGPTAPRFVIRGREAGFGVSPIPARPLAMPSPEALNLQGLASLATASGFAVPYHDALEQHFRAQPYAAYHAWSRVPSHLAEPFLKAVVLGVQGGQFGRVDFGSRIPPDFARYAAAKALEERHIPTLSNWRKRALESATEGFHALLQRPGLTLSATDRRLVTEAILILLLEEDPQAMAALRDPAVLAAYVDVDAAVRADALRLLVDRLGPIAWQWAGAQAGPLESFLWRSEEEMQLVLRAMPQALSEPTRAAVRQWLEAPAMATQDVSADADPPEAEAVEPANPALAAPQSRRERATEAADRG